MITHLAAREWAEVLGIAAGIFLGGAVGVWGWHQFDAWDDFNTGPDGWKGWEGTKSQSPAPTPRDGRDGRGGGK